MKTVERGTNRVVETIRDNKTWPRGESAGKGSTVEEGEGERKGRGREGCDKKEAQRLRPVAETNDV